MYATDGESEPYLIGTEEEGEETGFQSASRKTYIIRAPHLGPLTRVAIRQLPNEGVHWLEEFFLLAPSACMWWA